MFDFTSSYPLGYFDFGTSNGRTYYATLELIDECGSSGETVHRQSFKVSSGSVDPEVIMIVSPNPADTHVTIQLQDETPPADMLNNKTFALDVNKPRALGVYEIQLWSASSLLQTHKTDQSTYQISVSDLPAGIYFVRVIKNGEVYTRKLIKN